MKNTKITNSGKAVKEKVKKALNTRWAELGPILKKNIDILLFALSLAVLAAALGRLASNKTIGKSAPRIVFTHWWQDAPEKETLQDLMEEFEDLHRDIKIEIKYRTYEDLRSDLFNPAENNSPGDVFALDLLWVPELIKREIMESRLTESLWSEDPAPQNYNAPLLSFINVLYYNIELLKEAGFTRPPKNRGEFLNCLEALAGIKDVSSFPAGLAMDMDGSRGIYDDVFPWIWSSGELLIRDGEPVVNSRSVVESLSFLASLKKEGYIVPGKSNENKLDNFISGRAAFMIAPASNITRIRERMGDEAFGFTTIPVPDNYAGVTYYGTAGWTLGINKSSVNKEEARLLADFLAKNASILSEKTGAMPANDPPTDPFHLKVWDITIAAESADVFIGLPWTELEEIFRKELDAIFNEKTTASEAASAIQAGWQEILAKQ